MRCFQKQPPDVLWNTSTNDCFCISEIQTTNNVIYILTENFIFSFSICKIFSYEQVSSAELVFPFAFFSHVISNISRNISNVSFSSSLNRLNALSHYQKFLLIGFNKFRLYLAKLCSRDKHCTTASLIKVSPLKVGV